ncbi:MAG: nucleoside phosphorylase [Prevotellaceae bacterium]|jgi:uridine phosphorylase|nr:nucleoside phosphorylase [Prevotellaceae bacterium]
MKRIEESELIINEDGSIFHLHLKPEDIADTILLVGDPGRVNMIAAYFDNVELSVANREFLTVTGTYKGKRVSVLSTGIGTDNIDIVVTELDALANIDFETRTEKQEHKTLNLIRLGTSGAIQPEIAIGSFVSSHISIGFDGLLNFYANRDNISLLDFEDAFLKHIDWHKKLPTPYFVSASEALIKLFEDFTIEGMTVSAPGFYGPQGRVLRLPLWKANQNDLIESFEYRGKKITNFEMEGSAIAGLSHLLGHNAITVCTIIANRANKTALVDYKDNMRKMVEITLEKILKL